MPLRGRCVLSGNASLEPRTARDGLREAGQQQVADREGRRAAKPWYNRRSVASQRALRRPLQPQRDCQDPHSLATCAAAQRLPPTNLSESHPLSRRGTLRRLAPRRAAHTAWARFRVSVAFAVAGYFSANCRGLAAVPPVGVRAADAAFGQNRGLARARARRRATACCGQLAEFCARAGASPGRVKLCPRASFKARQRDRW